MRKSCKRVVRDPNWTTQRTGLTDGQVIDLGIAYRGALQGMLSGYGDQQLWSTLACSLNVGVVLTELGVIPESLDTLKAAQDALVSCRVNKGKRGKYAFNGSEQTAIKAAFIVHDRQIEKATKRQITLSLHEVNRRIETGAIL